MRRRGGWGAQYNDDLRAKLGAAGTTCSRKILIVAWLTPFWNLALIQGVRGVRGVRGVTRSLAVEFFPHDSACSLASLNSEVPWYPGRRYGTLY